MNRKAKAIELINQGASTNQVVSEAHISRTYVSDIRCAIGKRINHRKSKRNYLQTVELSELKL